LKHDRSIENNNSRPGKSVTRIERVTPVFEPPIPLPKNTPIENEDRELVLVVEDVRYMGICWERPSGTLKFMESIWRLGLFLERLWGSSAHF